MKKVLLALALAGCVAGWAETTSNKVEKAKVEPKKPETKEEEPEKPRPSFKPKERIPVDQGVDFPADI